MKAYKKGPTIKSIIPQQRGQMSVTSVFFSESAYQLIVKYFLAYCSWIVAWNFFYLVCDNVCNAIRWVNWWKIASKENIEAMAATAATATDGSNGNNAVEKATAEKASTAAATTSPKWQQQQQQQHQWSNGSKGLNKATEVRASISNGTPAATAEK